MTPYTDPTTGEWVGEYETKLPDGTVTRQTEWFDTPEEAAQFSRTGDATPEFTDAERDAAYDFENERWR